MIETNVNVKYEMQCKYDWHDMLLKNVGTTVGQYYRHYERARIGTEQRTDSTRILNNMPRRPLMISSE